MRFLDESVTSGPGFKSRVVPLCTFEIHAHAFHQVQNVNRPTEPMSALYPSGLPDFFALTLAISAVLHRSQGAYTQSHGTPRPNLCVPRARSGLLDARRINLVTASRNE